MGDTQRVIMQANIAQIINSGAAQGEASALDGASGEGAAPVEKKAEGEGSKEIWSYVISACVARESGPLVCFLEGTAGSGKATAAARGQEYAKLLDIPVIIINADTYFHHNNDGKNPGELYRYNPDKIANAHGWVKAELRKAVVLDGNDKPYIVIVDNTNVSQ